MNLIPFGKDKATGRLLDVSEVAKGEQCGCICPSCGTRLIARQGIKKEWHFAHKKDYHKGTHGPCQYSWFVALRMMIRQILSEENELYLPEYKKYHPINQKSIVVTQAQKLRYEQCATDTFEKGEKHSFDAKLFVREHPLHVFVSYKGREFRGYHHDEHLEGIIEIDLRGLTLVRQKRLTERSCVAQLRLMLKNPHPCKRWRYHNREVAIEEAFKREVTQQKKQIARQKKQKTVEIAAQRKLRNSPTKISLQTSKAAEFIENLTPMTDTVSEAPPIEAKLSVPSPPLPNPPVLNQTPPMESSKAGLTNADALARATKLKAGEVKDQPYHCIVCKHDYMGTKEGRNPCPLCNQHLYRRAL